MKPQKLIKSIKEFFHSGSVQSPSCPDHGPYASGTHLGLCPTCLSECQVKLREEHIRLLAYQLWEDAGKPAGNDLGFWLMAENMLDSGVEHSDREQPVHGVHGGLDE